MNVRSFRDKVVYIGALWSDGGLKENIKVRIDRNGYIVEIGQNICENVEFIDLRKFVLLPGFVNSHSHAFHRSMRGKSHIGSSEKDSFWKWREDMYSFVEKLDEDDLLKCTLGTFKEMLSAGITTVGEFHYLHHSKKEKFALDKVILEAARIAGIRLVLINTLYCRTGFTEIPLAEAQKKFISTIDEFIEATEKLEMLKGENQSIAIAVHSLRAVSMDDFNKLYKWNVKQNKVLHIHAEEQMKEVEDCITNLNSTPCELIIENSIVNSNITCVHCTQTDINVVRKLAEHGIIACICPLTEGYLGDGVPNITEEIQICLGTDCNNRICMLEEMRWLTYSQHMKGKTRNACGLDSYKLLNIATINGAKSLGIDHLVGQFIEGMQFDFVAFDLQSMRAEFPDSDLIDAIIFGCGNRDIVATSVSGIVVYERSL